MTKARDVCIVGLVRETVKFALIALTPTTMHKWYQTLKSNLSSILINLMIL